MPIADDFTVDDLVVKSANDLFTDREEPRKAFWDVYNSMVPGEYTAIAYYGVGGIGKTTLLKKLAKEIDEKVPQSKGLDHITYSFEEYTSKEVFLFNLSRQMKLRNRDLEFPLFDEAIAKICREGNRDIEKLKADAVASFSENPLIDTALSFLGEFLPGVDPATKIAERVVELTNNVIDAHERKHGKNAVLYNQIAYSDNKTLINDYLHEYFIYDVNEVMKKRTRPLVIFLDGYEKYVDSLNDAELTVGKDNWIHFVRKRLVNIPNTLWVVAGREKIKWKEDVLPEEQLHRIGNLSGIDTAEYFEKAGINDNALISQLYELCHGTPVYMDLCVRTYTEISKTRVPVIEDFGKDTSELARRYLEFMDKPTRRLLELISWLPNVWTKNMVTDIAEQINYDSYLPELNIILNLSLIEPIDLGYKLHETCRLAARNAGDNSELIQNGVVDYLKKKVLAPDNQDDKIFLLSQLLDVLMLADSVSIAEEEFVSLLDVFEDVRVDNGDYQENAAVSAKLCSYVEKNDSPAKIKTHCKSVRVYTLSDLGEYNAANELAVANYEYAVKELPENSEEVLDALQELAASYYYLGNFNKARELNERCYEVRKQILGEEDSATLTSLSNLASIYSELGEYSRAKELNERCYEIRKRVLGEEERSALVSLNNLASIHNALGEYNKAEELLTRCYEIRKRILGEEHPDTLVALGNLASVYSSLGEYNKAKELNEQCYETSRRVLGEKHPDTLGKLNNLINTYEKLGDCNKAIKLQEECYEIRRRVFGEEYPATFTSLNNLANAYGRLGEYNKAKELQARCYEISKRVLGEKHPYTLNACGNLARWKEALGESNCK